jgi:recombination protein RecT
MASTGIEQMSELQQIFAQRKKDIENVLPKHLTPERIMRVAWVLVRRTPKLLECHPGSVVESIVQASTLGLELGREAHLVPFGKQCVMIPDYKGIVALARRGDVKKLVARVVMEEDEFEVRYGTDDDIIHVPKLGIDRTNIEKIVAFYAVATFNDGTKQFEVMTKAEVDMVRAKSRAKNDGPWADVQAYPEMGKKTVVKRLGKYLPQTPELATAIEMDNRYESGEASAVTIFDDEETASVIVKEKTKERADALKEKLGKAEDQGEAEEVEPTKPRKPRKKKKSAESKEEEAGPGRSASSDDASRGATPSESAPSADDDDQEDLPWNQKE